VAHLDGDKTTTDDAEALRQIVKTHDRVRRVEAHLGKSRNLWHNGASTSSKQDLVAANRALAAVVHVDTKDLVADERGRTFEERDVRAARRAVLAAACGNLIDSAKHAITNCPEVSTVELRVDTELGAISCSQCCVSGKHEHFGRDTAHIETGTPVDATLHNGNVPVAEVLGNRVTGTRSDNHQVELFVVHVVAHDLNTTTNKPLCS
jgi:hypothetical protein